MQSHLIRRYQVHLNEYCADWDVPDSLRYVLQGEGQEPLVSMSNHGARFYTSWLEHQGFIPKAERQWFWAARAKNTSA